MAEPSNELLEMLLRECQATTPQPWYPSIYVKETGLDRGMIDHELDRLRMTGLLRLTEWVQGNGQGYVLTPEGMQVLQSPRLLRQLRDGKPVTLRVEPIEEPAAFRDSPWDRGEAVREVLINPAKPRATLTLVFINILVFLIGLSMAMDKGVSGEYLGFSADPQVLSIQSTLGSLNRFQVVQSDQWWRLISYCFVHGGLLHLLMNMYFLYVVGPMVETMWGSARYLLLYLISGLAGGCGVVLANQGPLELQSIVGASGALCGILASMGVWVYLNRQYLGPELSSRWLRGIMTNVLLIVLISMLPRVSAMGHFAGGAGGAVVALPMVFQRFGRGMVRVLGTLGVAAVPIVCVGLVLGSITGEDRSEQYRRELRNAIAEANNSIKRTMDFVQPLMKGDAKDLFGSQANLERAARDSKATREILQSAGKVLREERNADAEVKEAAKLAQGYVDSYTAFLDTLDRLLAAKASPTGKDYAIMNDQIGRGQQFFRDLKASIIFAR